MRLEAGVFRCSTKINVELIVVAVEAEAIVAELNAALDRLNEWHALFGGGIETVAVANPKTRKRSALAHTKAARASLTVALRAVKAPRTLRKLIDHSRLRPLMDGAKADFVIIDPPYNVVIDGHATGLGKIRHREFGMASGK
jgi:hypothetical protein